MTTAIVGSGFATGTGTAGTGSVIGTATGSGAGSAATGSPIAPKASLTTGPSTPVSTGTASGSRAGSYFVVLIGAIGVAVLLQ